MIRVAFLALVALLLSAAPAYALPVAVVAGFFGITNAVVAAVATFIVNTVISTVVNIGLNKLFGPKQQAAASQTMQDRQASVTTMSVGESPREMLVGETVNAGTLGGAFNYGGTYGTDRVVRIQLVADHKCDSLQGFFVNDEYVTFAGDGVVTGFNGQLSVYWRNGSAGQTFPAALLTAWQGSPIHSSTAPATANIFNGMAYVVFDYAADIPQQTTPVFTSHPQFLPRVRGKLCYDPRKDSTVGGSGSHRWNNPATWEWTRNAKVIRYNWLRGVYALDQVGSPQHLLVGRGLSELEAPPAREFAGANVCDELVNDGAGGTEKRYFADGVIRANDPHLTVEGWFEAAMGGAIIQPEGGVDIEPGQAKTAVYYITDDDLLDGFPVEFNEFRSQAQRVNTVISRYIEPSQKWQDHAAPVLRDLADLTADGGPLEQTLPLTLVTRTTQAQRLGEQKRRKARLERTAKISVGPRFAEAEENDWIVWTSARHTKGLPVTFQIASYSQDKAWNSTWALEETAASVFASYVPTPATGGMVALPDLSPVALSGVVIIAYPITGPNAALMPGVKATWTIPVDKAITGVRMELRKVGSTDIAPVGESLPATGVFIGTAGVPAGEAIEVRVVPVAPAGRAVTPSAWVPLTSGGMALPGQGPWALYTAKTPTGALQFIDGTTGKLTRADALGAATAGFGQALVLDHFPMTSNNSQIIIDTFTVTGFGGFSRTIAGGSFSGLPSGYSWHIIVYWPTGGYGLASNADLDDWLGTGDWFFLGTMSTSVSGTFPPPPPNQPGYSGGGAGSDYQYVF